MAGAPVAALQRVPLFADLSADEVQQIALLFKERHFAAGETRREGGRRRRGVLPDRVGRGGRLGGRQGARRRCRPGDHFGEIALIDEGVRSATITATTDLVCYGLTFWEFKPLVVANGEIGWKLLHYLAQKLRSAELE